MPIRNLFHRTLWAALAIAACGPAGAVPLLATPNIMQVVNVGTQHYSEAVGSVSNTRNNTVGSTSVALGGSPTITSAMSETSLTAGVHGGSTYATLNYQFEFYNPGAGSGNINVHVNAFDQLLASAAGYSASANAESVFEISGGGISKFINHCTGFSTDGSNPCGSKGTLAVVPFNLTLKQNTVYTVQMNVYADAVANYDVLGTSSASASAVLDPSFSIVGGAPAGGSFIYSAGVTAVPEPASWALLIAGLACVGGIVRRRFGPLNPAQTTSRPTV